MAENKNYIDLISDLLNQLREITLMTLTESGVENNSNLNDSIKYVATKDGINMIAASYYPYVSQGRRANIRRVPLSALIDWIKRYNIRPRNGQTINQLAFAIQTSIYKRGIKAKNFVDKVETGVADYTANALANELAIVIADDLVEMFAPVE